MAEKSIGQDQYSTMRTSLVLTLVCYTDSFPSHWFQPIGASKFLLISPSCNSNSNHNNKVQAVHQQSLIFPTKTTESSSLNLETKDGTQGEGSEYDFLSSLDESIYGTAFVKRLYDLQAFREKFGHCRVPKRYAPNKTLGNFVNKTRQMYRKYNERKKSSMTPERIEVLNLMGFDWGTERIKPNVSESSGMTLAWKEKLKEFKRYKETHGDAKIPSSSSLARWCVRQRREYQHLNMGEKSSMTEEKIAALKSVNFDFDPSETTWNLRIQQLMDYKKQYGDCMVPAQYEANPQLGRWVNTQRKYYKLYEDGLSSRISAKRIKQLNSLDFCWSKWDNIWFNDSFLCKELSSKL